MTTPGEHCRLANGPEKNVADEKLLDKNWGDFQKKTASLEGLKQYWQPNVFSPWQGDK